MRSILVAASLALTVSNMTFAQNTRVAKYTYVAITHFSYSPEEKLTRVGRSNSSMEEAKWNACGDRPAYGEIGFYEGCMDPKNSASCTGGFSAAAESKTSTYVQRAAGATCGKKSQAAADKAAIDACNEMVEKRGLQAQLGAGAPEFMRCNIVN